MRRKDEIAIRSAADDARAPMNIRAQALLAHAGIVRVRKDLLVAGAWCGRPRGRDVRLHAVPCLAAGTLPEPGLAAETAFATLVARTTAQNAREHACHAAPGFRWRLGTGNQRLQQLLKDAVTQDVLAHSRQRCRC